MANLDCAGAASAGIGRPADQLLLDPLSKTGPAGRIYRRAPGLNAFARVREAAIAAH